MGISEDDEAAIWANLLAQGLEGLTVVEFNSGKKLVAPEIEGGESESVADIETKSTCSAAGAGVSSSSSHHVWEESQSPPVSPRGKGGRHGNNRSGASSLVLG